MSWATIGKGTVLVVAWLVVQGALAIIELYWPGVYEFVVDGLVGLALVWALFWRLP